MEYISFTTSILTSILTGGVLVLFIENQHITSFVWTRYESIMSPFLHRLTCIIQWISTCNSAIELPRVPNKTLEEYKKSMNSFRSLNHKTIMGGRDIPLDYLSAAELDKVCCEINNIWNYGCRNYEKLKGTSFNDVVYNDTAKEKLLVVFQDIPLSQKPLTIEHLIKVTGKFYSEIYSPLKHISVNYEIWSKRSTCFKKIAIVTIVYCLCALMLLILWPTIPLCYMNLITILSITLFCGTLYYLIQIDKLSRKMFR